MGVGAPSLHTQEILIMAKIVYWLCVCVCVCVYACIYRELAHEHLYTGSTKCQFKDMQSSEYLSFSSRTSSGFLPESLPLCITFCSTPLRLVVYCTVCARTHTFDPNTCCPFVWDWQKTPVTLMDKVQCSESENPLLVGSNFSYAVHSLFHLLKPLLRLGALILEPIPAVFWWRRGYILHSFPDYCRATQWDRQPLAPTTQFWFSSLPRMFLDFEMKLGNPEKNREHKQTQCWRSNLLALMCRCHPCTTVMLLFQNILFLNKML